MGEIVITCLFRNDHQYFIRYSKKPENIYLCFLNYRRLGQTRKEIICSTQVCIEYENIVIKTLL